MIYEMRVYHAVPGKLPAVLDRFQNHALRIWDRFGIRQVGFWTTEVGESSNDLTYLLAWQSLEERERKWNAFMTDPEWVRIRAETQKDGPLLNGITNQLLIPTAFSALK
jgi:hypothetical protein